MGGGHLCLGKVPDSQEEVVLGRSHARHRRLGTVRPPHPRGCWGPAAGGQPHRGACPGAGVGALPVNPFLLSTEAFRFLIRPLGWETQAQNSSFSSPKPSSTPRLSAEPAVLAPRSPTGRSPSAAPPEGTRLRDRMLYVAPWTTGRLIPVKGTLDVRPGNPFRGPSPSL